VIAEAGELIIQPASACSCLLTFSGEFDYSGWGLLFIQFAFEEGTVGI